MAEAHIHDIDEGVQESFEFRVKGHSYLFRYLNTEELEAFLALTGKDLEQAMYQYITKKDPASPDFPEIARKMISPQWANFTKMIEAEFGR